MLTVENITKSYCADGVENRVLKGVSLHIAEKSFVCISGRSGSGKSTLLNVMSTLLKPDSGSIKYNRHTELTTLSDKKLNHLRHKDFSVVFQFHHLFPYLSVMENVLLPFMSGIMPVSGHYHRFARTCIDRVGLQGKHNRLPGQLSGGEQQRVAIARALVKSPKIVFADEPTGNLDKQTGNEIVTLLRNLVAEGLTVIMVTHENEYKKLADRVIEMEDGNIKSAA